jgi:hypothetical protein
MSGEQMVLIVLKIFQGKLDSDSAVDTIWKLQDLLEEEVGREQVGYVDGHEFSDNELLYYIYGPSADEIYKVIKPVVIGLPYLPGSHIVKRYGEGECGEVTEYLAYN